MAIKKDPEKSADLPPRGSRNADPITDQPGSHPIETGLGAAVGGVASGMAVGSVAGPVGTAIGAAVGAVAGGLAGKGVGELIDPTTEDNWLRDNFDSRPYVQKGETFETYEDAYRYGGESESQFQGRRFDDVESDIRSGWDSTRNRGGMTWDRARGAVRDAFDRTCQIRADRSRTGHAIDVPVDRDDIMDD